MAFYGQLNLIYLLKSNWPLQTGHFQLVYIYTYIYIYIYIYHPPSVLKQIPKGIARRLSDISANPEVLKQAAPEYEDALKNSGFSEKLDYCPERPARRVRRRKIIRYNPPFARNVKINIGKEFLKLIKSHFHERHAFNKIFNKHSVKLSYSCTKNVASIISGHNKRVVRTVTAEAEGDAERKCNCRNKDQCPLENECLTDNIVYQASVKNEVDEEVKSYVGLCSTRFKDRLAVHRQHMNNRAHRTKCELANHVWQLKDDGKRFTISWKILKKVRGRLVGGACRLCTTEQLLIVEFAN